mmetsp:Transcript_66471/g.183623  ORF Transcript_66471/g.183623 Transcript_66471/m.183623 type:complete len:194 (-) Transcript_66471:571-1152(-)
MPGIETSKALAGLAKLDDMRIQSFLKRRADEKKGKATAPILFDRGVTHLPRKVEALDAFELERVAQGRSDMLLGGMARGRFGDGDGSFFDRWLTQTGVRVPIGGGPSLDPMDEPGTRTRTPYYQRNPMPVYSSMKTGSVEPKTGFKRWYLDYGSAQAAREEARSRYEDSVKDKAAIDRRNEEEAEYFAALNGS